MTGRGLSNALSCTQAMEAVTPTTLRQSLRGCVDDCSIRGLSWGAKWAAEALNSLPKSQPGDSTFQYTDEIGSRRRDWNSFCSEEESDRYALAKCYFDCREYDHASETLDHCPSSKSVFLKLYARFMSGEKKKDEDSEMVMGPRDGEVTPNRELQPLIAELRTLMKRGCQEPFLLYLYVQTLPN